MDEVECGESKQPGPTSAPTTIVEVAGSRGAGLGEAARTLCVVLAFAAAFASGFATAWHYAGAFDRRLGPCKLKMADGTTCPRFLIAIGSESHQGGCACPFCTVFGIRKEGHVYTQIVCPVGHRSLAPARQP